MKKTIITFVLSLLFMFSTAFTGDTRDNQVDRDSTNTVTVQFENPRILIDDHRALTAWTEILRSNAAVDSAKIEMMDGLNHNLSSYVESQERREKESGMDYLTRRTGLTSDEIITITEKRHRTKKIESIIYLLMILISSMVAFNKQSGLKGGWYRQMALFIALLLLSTLTIYATDRLLLMSVNLDYHSMIELLNLSG